MGWSRRRRLCLVLLVCFTIAWLIFAFNSVTLKKLGPVRTFLKSTRNRVALSPSARESRRTTETPSYQRPIAWETCVDLLQRNTSEMDLNTPQAVLMNSHHTHLAVADVGCVQYTHYWQLNPSSGMNTRDFPLAYILVVHKDAAQVELLLHSIYTPYNVYCIHVDKDTPSAFRVALSAIASCYDNVFIANRLESVVYGGYSRLQADLNCLYDLVNSPIKWQYVINLAGQDFPLKTQNEIVAQLKVFGGQNDIPGVQSSSDIHVDRTRFVHRVVASQKNVESFMVKTGKMKSPPPHNMTIYTGSAYYIASRPFMSWVLTDKIARDLLEWSQDTYSPDEFYWVTLNKQAAAPGGFPYDTWASSVRAIKWVYFEGTKYPPCRGKYVRDVCIFGVGDLQWLVNRHHLFANKFDLNFDPVVVHCLWELLRWREEHRYDSKFTCKDFPRKDMPWVPKQ